MEQSHLVRRQGFPSCQHHTISLTLFTSLQAAAKLPKFGCLKGKGGRVGAWKPRCFPLLPRKKPSIVLATWFNSFRTSSYVRDVNSFTTNHMSSHCDLSSLILSGLQEARKECSCENQEWDGARQDYYHIWMGNDKSGPQPVNSRYIGKSMNDAGPTPRNPQSKLAAGCFSATVVANREYLSIRGSRDRFRSQCQCIMIKNKR